MWILRILLASNVFSAAYFAYERAWQRGSLLRATGQVLQGHGRSATRDQFRFNTDTCVLPVL